MKLRKGFTLIELLVVVAIIGILSTIVISSINNARASARDAQRLSDIRTIQTALEAYASENGGRYPTPGWVYSNNATNWENLGDQLGIALPTDPLNEAGTAGSGSYTYGYWGRNTSRYCFGRAYMLVVNLERKNDTSPGIYFCLDGDGPYGYGNAVVVGMDGEGSLVGPQL
jgi:prepilin-type N-terminal cleavage/methylation domain-containing protein